jgi:hypothetical protein
MTIAETRRDKLLLAKYKRSDDWLKVSRRFRKRNPSCAACPTTGTNRNNPVHHIKPYQWWPELELEESNLITLCRTHHWTFGHLCDWKSYNLNVVEDAEIWREKIENRPKWRQF